MTDNTASSRHALGRLSRDRSELLKLLREEKFKSVRGVIPNRRRDGNGDGNRAPASWAQQRLWFIDQLEGGSGGYCIPIAKRLIGPLDVASLQRALDALSRRHEVLRTVFVSSEGDPEQEIQLTGNLNVTVTDLSEYPQDEREAIVDQKEIEEVQNGFKLSTGPLIRAGLLRLSATEHVLLVTMHHIISDGWSVDVFLRELAQLYRTYAAGGEEELSPLPLQYSDYAYWQRDWFQGRVLETQMNYWRSRLGGAAVLLELPTDRPRPEVQSYRGKSLPVALDAHLTTNLRQLARQYEMTLFMVLCAGWAILLSRLSGQSDISIGTPVANRRRPELEGLIGFFVNTLVLRVGARGDQSLNDFLQHVKDMSLGAYEHQDLPFEKVVEAVQPSRSLSRNPLFQVMFALQNTPKTELELPGISVVDEEMIDEPSIFDLFISLEERGDQLFGYVNYATDLFDRATVERWMESFAEVLAAMSRGSHVALSGLSILPEGQRRQVIVSFNATQHAFPQTALVHELFEQQTRRTPEAVAVRHASLTLSYGQLNARANRLARHLGHLGVLPGDIVAICVERSLEMVVGVLAILKAGAAYLPLDPIYPRERLQHMLDDAAPKAILIQERLREIVPDTPGKPVAMDSLSNDGEDCFVENMPSSALGLGASSLVYLIYTSGSTGRPKGTAMEHRSMVNLIEWHRRTLGDSAGQRVLQFAALSFDVAFQEIFSTLCTGGMLVLLDEWTRRDPEALTDLLITQSINRLFVPPLMLQGLAEFIKTSERIPTNLRDVITAGEQLRISPEIVSLFQRSRTTRLHNHYGPTETHVVTALTMLGTPDAWPTLPSIGRPISNTQIYVLDDMHEPVPLGVIGEIYIGGVGVARGYRRRPEMTSQRFVADPFHSDGRARMYKTGDLGKWRQDGTLEYLGRNDDQVKLRGYRIELGEVQMQLSRHAAVKEATVVVRSDAPGEHRLVAYIVPRQTHQTPTAEDLRSHLITLLPDFMVPTAFVTLEQLPQTPNGKLDRSALPAPDLSACISQQYEAPCGAMEEALATIWRGVLKVERVGRYDNFFALGGHSLLVTKLIAKMAERLSLKISVATVFRSPTVLQLARAIQSLRESALDIANPPQQSQTREVDIGVVDEITTAPLAYTQLQHWNIYRLHEEPAYRFVAGAIRLTGSLDADLLRRSIDGVIVRQGALRTRIVNRIDGPIQEISRSINWHFQQDDLTGMPAADREAEVVRRIEQIILKPINIATDPLFGLALFRLNAMEHILVLAGEHSIFDGASLGVFFRDLFSAYERHMCGVESRALPLPVQFAEYAARQRRGEHSWIEHHSRYWAERLAGWGALRMPEDTANVYRLSGWTIAKVRIEQDLKLRLNDWARQRGTTAVMSVFTAYVALVLRWTNQNEGVLQHIINSRTDPALEDTIGYFASPIHLRIALSENDTFIDLLKSTITEYCNALEHADLCFLEAQIPRPDYTRTVGFNWISQGSTVNTSLLENSNKMIRLSAVPFGQPILRILDRDTEPFLLLFDTDEAAEGGIYFPLSRFSKETMDRFARNFRQFLDALLQRPNTKVSDVPFVE